MSREAGPAAASLHRAYRGIAKMIDSSCDYWIPWTCAEQSFLGPWTFLLKKQGLAFDASLGEMRHELFAELRKQLAGLLFAHPLTCIVMCLVML